ncbi:MFS transporter [Advenella kashmirensis W13003]|uniref:MFS transporter n=1 Tax=Advenella kashmirensis W13003 TaxID=1424334 RepID=V8QTV9_9BURK|nr:tripartite tricarboxylate transporter substrate binding protein [Advenella kashmirensis]ETF03381.1 MFS transporter [Advenella kashmirensis W13003]
MRQKLVSAVMALLFVLPMAPALAAYPEKPIRIIVGFPAGQATDIVARLAAKTLESALKQSVFVENKPGASGIIGAMDVVRAAPDGYTLLVTSSGPLAINPSLYTNLAYDPLRDIAPVTELSEVPLFLAVNAKLPMKTASEFVDYVKANPGKLNYGSAGSGVTSHLAMELLKHGQGLDIRHVPYKGSPPAVADLIGGHVQAMVDTGPALLPVARRGDIRILATLNDKRNAAVPEVPTAKEAGIGELATPAWVGLGAPKGTPPEIIDTLYKALEASWKTPENIKVLQGLGSEAVLKDPQVFRQYIADEIKKWKVAVDVSGAQVN